MFYLGPGGEAKRGINLTSLFNDVFRNLMLEATFDGTSNGHSTGQLLKTSLKQFSISDREQLVALN